MTGKPSLMEMLKAAAEAHQSMRLPKPEAVVPDAVPVRKPDTLDMTNNQGGKAPPLVLMKRTEAPMPTFSDLIKSADALIRAGGAANIEAANDCLEKADRLLDKSNHFHFYGDNTVDDDEDDFESPSDPSNDDPSDDDEEDNEVKKASEHYGYHGYGGTASPATPSSYGRGPDQSADPYATGSNRTTGAPSKTAFDHKVDMVMARDGVARHIAMQTARNEFNREFSEHQNSLSEGPTRNQHAHRSAGQATKSAPTYYEDLLSREMAKGCNMEIAAQRVAQQYGYDAQRNYPSMIRKGADLSERFARIVKSIYTTEDVTKEEATRLARHRNPALYRAMNSF
jgi:hypothetical protein